MSSLPSSAKNGDRAAENDAFTGTVLENIRWGKEDATEEEAIEAARMAQAHEFIAATPEGYQTRVGQGGVNFSGGKSSGSRLPERW